MTWNLDRPELPALPSSYFWTWDHSTNWVLDDPHLVTSGCYNKYLKKPETYVEDYRRLTDLACGLGIRGILIWGFLRDSHGGIEAGKQVAGYAHSKGVAIMPGIGTTWYGGCYYEGDHRYNLETFLKKNPEARLSNPAYDVYGVGVCPTHPLFVEWIQEGVQWLFDEFAIGGANLENGDFVVCLEPRCQAHKAAWPESDPDFFRMQFMGYDSSLRQLQDLLHEKLISYATYTGVVPGQPTAENPNSWAYMKCDRPAMLDRMPHEAVCQWTLTDMVRRKPLPLVEYLDNGIPPGIYDNPYWPKGLKTPARHAAGFIHQGSQWSGGRYEPIVSTIKEACLRAYQSGLEGVVIHGEVTSRHIPSALNYLAFSHFIYWPEDTLRDFGRRTLGQVLDSEEEGGLFIEIYSHWESGTLSDGQREEANQRARKYEGQVAKGQDYERWRFWSWLSRMVNGWQEKHTASFF